MTLISYVSTDDLMTVWRTYRIALGVYAALQELPPSEETEIQMDQVAAIVTASGDELRRRAALVDRARSACLL